MVGGIPFITVIGMLLFQSSSCLEQVCRVSWIRGSEGLASTVGSSSRKEVLHASIIRWSLIQAARRESVAAAAGDVSRILRLSAMYVVQ